MTLYPKLILDALATVRYPGTGKNLVEAEMVADNLRIDGMTVSFSLIFEKPTDPFMKSMLKAAETAIHTYVSPDVQVTITAESKQAARPEVGKLLPQVKNIVGIAGLLQRTLEGLHQMVGQLPDKADCVRQKNGLSTGELHSSGGGIQGRE